MTKMIQVRNVPEELHRELRRRAEARHQTLTGYIHALLEREVSRPVAEDVFDRIRTRSKVHLSRSAADYVREARDEREAELAQRSQ